MDSQQNYNTIHAEIIGFHQKKEFEKCLELIEESLTENQTNTHHKILQASCWTALNIKGPETFELLKKVIEDDPTNSFAYYGIGLKHYNEGNLAESQKYLIKAIELNPTNAMQKAVELKCKAKSVMEAICDANVKFEANSFEKAMRALSTAHYIDPENEKIQKKILEIKQFFIKELVERLEHEVMAELTETCKEHEIDQKLVKAENLLKKGKMEKANKITEEVSNFNPKHKDLEYLRGLSHYMLGNLKDAIEVLNEVLNDHTDHAMAKELRAKALKLNELINSAAEKMQQKKYEESIAILTEVVAIDPKNVKINQAAFFQRSLCHYSLGNSSNAFTDFKQFEAMQKGNEMKLEM